MLEFKSKIAINVLAYFFLNPKEKRYVNELARIIDADPGNLDRMLKKLESEGLLESETSGKQKYYYLNKGYPLLKEVEALFNSKFGVKQKLSDALKNLSGLEEAYIFGSYAKGGFGQDSDIDILLIGSHSAIEAKKIVARINKNLKREFNILDMTAEELSDKKRDKDGFVENIFKGKVIKII